LGHAIREESMKRRTLALSSSSAFAFVVTMGIVNLFGDVTYEGGASINGPFLGSLGASAAAISIIAGIGEFLGYSMRSVSGYVADKTGKHWLVTFVGYAVNLLAVPAMAVAGNWYVAGALIFAERTGRAIRKPTVEAMLSYSTGALGKGWVYALKALATRCRTPCSTPSWRACCQKADGVWHSDCSIQAMVSVGWLEAPPPVCCTTDPCGCDRILDERPIRLRAHVSGRRSTTEGRARMSER
jgi:hypothetical protein